MTHDELIAIDPILAYFSFEHLPPVLKDVSAPFSALAFKIALDLPRSPERTVAFRKLLEAKDCAVRCAVDKMKQSAKVP